MSNNIITINFTNTCGCCGDSSTSGGSSTSDGTTPSDGTFTPDGFSASTLDDRACKVAVWLYDWVRGWLQYADEDKDDFIILLRTIAIGVSRVLGDLVGRVISYIVALIGTPGPTPDDPAWLTIIPLITRGVVYFTASKGVNQLEAAISSTIAKFTAQQDEFICALAQGTSPEDVKARFNTYVESNFDEYEQVLIKMFVPDTFFNLFYYSADWWPSFETDYLATITETCCGNFTNGAQLTPASTEGCQTAHWIIDNLVATFYGVHEYMGAYFTPMGDGQIIPYPFLDDTPRFYELVQSELPKYIPAKVVSQAGNITGFYWGVAQYLNYQLGDYVNQPSALFEMAWYNLGGYLAGQKATLLTQLQAALNANDVYNILYTPLAAWIDANADAGVQTFMKNAVSALLTPNSTGPGLAALMFYQDSDLAFYNVSDCDGSTPPAGCITTYDYDSTLEGAEKTAGYLVEWADYGGDGSVKIQTANGETIFLMPDLPFRANDGQYTVQVTAHKDASANTSGQLVAYVDSTRVMFTNINDGNDKTWTRYLTYEVPPGSTLRFGVRIETWYRTNYVQMLSVQATNGSCS